MEITHILGSPTTWTLYLLLLIICSIYAVFVRWLRHSEESSQTPWLVVVGNSILLLFVTAVIAFAVDTETAITVAVVVLLANVFGGLPMIIEYVTDYTARRQRERRNRQIADVGRRIEGE